MAFADAVAELHPSLLARAVELSGDPVIAEDLLQETYVVLLEDPPRFEGDVKLLHWLRTCMYNLWARHLEGRPWPSQLGWE